MTGSSGSSPSSAEATPAVGQAGTQGTHRRWRAGELAARAVLLVPGIVLLLLDAYDLGRVSLWRDEAYTVDAANRSLPQILALLAHNDAVNSTYYLLMRGDIALAGTSPAALRLPSLLAMAVAAVLTAVIGARLARAARLPAPTLAGLLAGLLFAVAPEVTRYAQEARAYGLVTMCATIATYLLLRAIDDDRWRWWVGYGAAIGLMGLFNLLALTLLVPHAVTLGIARTRGWRGAGTPMLRWLAVAGAAILVLCPVLVLAFGQRQQINWLTAPGPWAGQNLADLFAGSKHLVDLVVIVALIGVVGAVVSRPKPLVDAVTLALPWLVLPVAILLVVSLVHPVYDFRYVVFCLPAVALLFANGLFWLTRLTLMAFPAPPGKLAAALSWLPAIVALAVFAGLVLAPQRAVRLPSARTDNLAKVAAIVAATEQPGDAVLYLPENKRVYGMAYPAPFERLWDITLARSPLAAGNLLGTEVTAARLRARFAHVRRIWVVSGPDGARMLAHPALAPEEGLEQVSVMLLSRFHLVHQWHTQHDWLSLYSRA